MIELFILLSVAVVSLASLVGIATLSLKAGILKKILNVLVALGAGTLIGGAFFDLIPGAVNLAGNAAFLYMVYGIIIFLVLEKLIHWHHHHHVLAKEEQDHLHKEPVKPFAYLNLLGDAVHNFLDGTIIAASYYISLELGIVSTIAILLHEIPQEIGDFGILIQGGLSTKKALIYNFLVALTAVAGAFAVMVLGPIAGNFEIAMISIAAGGFLYIALANLIPELQHETKPRNIILQVLFLLLGIALLFYIGGLFPE